MVRKLLKVLSKKIGAGTRYIRTHPVTKMLGAVALGAIIGLITLAVILEVSFQNRVYPGVVVGNFNAGGLSQEQVQSSLVSATDIFSSRPVEVRSQNSSLSVNPSDIGLSFDPGATWQEAYLTGRQTDPWESWREKIRALFGQVVIPLTFSFNQERLNAQLEALAAQVDRAAQNAAIDLTGGVVSITTPRDGQKIDLAVATKALRQKIGLLSQTPVIVNPIAIRAELTEEEAQAAAAAARTALAYPVKLNFRDRSWVVEPEQIRDLLTFATAKEGWEEVRLEVSGTNLSLGRIKLLSRGAEFYDRPKLSLSLDQEKLSDFLDTIATSIDQPAVDARFRFSNGILEVIKAEVEGREVDRDVLATALLAKLVAPSDREIEIPVRLTKPKVTAAMLPNLGIKDLLGRGVSRYTGSIIGRNQNIALAASRVNGALVAPGESFSLYKTIGDVSQGTGYALSYVIVGRRTELDYGGGVCQISTTLFRGALNAGLPIVERHPHAFRVGYYELDSAAGLDASIYFPYSDFRFRNDTPGYILIQTINDPSTATLTFEFYGTSDGRQSKLTTPFVSNITPAPAPLYQDDATLPKGTIKQIDFANNGATAVFSRTVTRDGQVVLQDSWYTKYQPWQAIYLVGTKEN